MMKKLFQKGMTLIEAVIALSIFTVVIAAISVLIYSLYRSQSFTLQQSIAVDEARKGIETMVKEIKEAKNGDDGSFTIEKADDFEFIFFSDIDRDTATERVRYFLEGTNFKKGVIEPTSPPVKYDGANEKISVLSLYARNETNAPIFTYYNGDWPADKISNPLPTPTRLKDTKLMHVYLIINIDPSRPPKNFELESDVQIRNLKTNL